MSNYSFDALIMTTATDYKRVAVLHKRMVQNLPVRKVIFVGNQEVRQLVANENYGECSDKVSFLDENELLPFDNVQEFLSKRLFDILNGERPIRGITGWYYQQFLKMQYSLICKDDYYMTWDGDTVACKTFNMFSETNQPFFDVKTEYHEEYFNTMNTLIPDLGKVVDSSFISEHMLFNTSIMKELIGKIEANTSLNGEKYYEKIFSAITPENLLSNSFSEFETYGSYTLTFHPDAYALRDWQSFRLGGEFFNPNTISDRDFDWMGRDFSAISFEKKHSIREDHANLFDNPYYQNKLSAKQMVDIVREEYGGVI